MRFTPRSSHRAFTLVELLVVIGIIAALIGILLPVLSGVQARGRDLKCQSNLRQIVQGMLGYSSEHKGSLPWGICYNRVLNQVHPDPYNTANTWANDTGNNPNNLFFCFSSQVGKYMNPRADGLYGNISDDGDLGTVFQCAELLQGIPHHLGYACNMVALPSPRDERRITSPNNPRAHALKPALVTNTLKEGTALVWDTAMEPGWFADDIIGYVVGADIDGQRFWQGASVPQYRYFNQRDPFGFLPPGVFGNNAAVSLNVGSNVWRNIDPPDNSTYPYQGNLRFRHNKDTTCNVGFSDGSVRQFTGKFKSDKTLQNAGPLGATHDAYRKLFMTKWPSGIPAAPGVPGG